MARKRARGGDPATSHAAGGDTPNKKADEMVVWSEYWYAHPKALATFEMENRLGGHENGRWRKRRSDLSGDGFLVDTGEDRRNPETGCKQDVYALSPDEALRHEKWKNGDNDAAEFV